MKSLAHALIASLCIGGALPALAQSSVEIVGTRIAVPTHDIERGEVITAADLNYVTVTPDRIRPGLAMDVADLDRHEARRPLRAGDPVRIQDVRLPILVSKGQTVTMTYSEPGISLTAVGRAVSDGGLGESVVVENPVSFRQVSCIVTAPGEVRASDAIPSSAAKIAENP